MKNILNNKVYFIYSKIRGNRFLIFIMERTSRLGFIRNYLKIEYETFGLEKFHSYGNLNSDRQLYIIRRRPLGAGMYSNIFHVLGHIIYCIERNYIPVVDMENYPTHYNDSKSFNSWNLFFDDVSEVTLEDAYLSKNVILSNWNSLDDYFNIDMIMNLNGINHINVNKFNKYFSEYISYNVKLAKLIEENLERMNFENKSVLCIMIRGTDYNYAQDHKKQPNLEDIINLVEKFILDGKADLIYLTTEEQKIIDFMSNLYTDKLRYLSRPRVADYNEDIFMPNYRFDRPNDKLLTAQEYLIEIEIASKCEYLICGINGGSAAAIIRNNSKYKEVIVI